MITAPLIFLRELLSSLFGSCSRSSKTDATPPPLEPEQTVLISATWAGAWTSLNADQADRSCCEDWTPWSKTAKRTAEELTQTSASFLKSCRESRRHLPPPSDSSGTTLDGGT